MIYDLKTVKSFLLEKGHFRYNVIRGAIELKSPGQESYQTLTDYELNTLRFDMKEHGINISQSDLIGLLISEFSEKFDPIQSYFDKLPPWNPSMPGFIKSLADTIQVEDQNLWERMLQVWLVSVVACSLQQNVNELMLILVGDQGDGKTRWIKKIIPALLKNYCWTGRIDFKNRDARINLSQCFLIVMDEMANFKNRSSYADLKEWMSKDIIFERRAYGKFHESLPRRASHCGTTNESQFLFDDTGSRRYLAFEPLAIDYSHNVPIDMVFAQAKYLLHQGFHPYLSSQEIEEIQLHNRVFEYCSEEEELLLKYFQMPAAGIPELLTPTQILKRIAGWEPLPLSSPTAEGMGRALTKLKFPKKKTGGRSGYVVEVKRTLPNSATNRLVRPTVDVSIKEAVSRLFEQEGWH